MRYPAYLEVGPGGATRAFVFALPGVSVGARAPEAALAALPAAIAAEWTRLAATGRPRADDTAIDVIETERVTVTADVAGGATAALFQYELRATRPEDVALALDRLALAHEELTRAAAPGVDERLAAALVALAEGEWWLLSRLGNRPPAHFASESTPLERLASVHALVVERLTHLLPGDHERHAVFNAEPWTTRKVLRRLACLARDAAADVAAPPVTR